MTSKEYLESLNRNKALIYPYHDSPKFVFDYIIEDMTKTELKDMIIDFDVVDDNILPIDLYHKLEQCDKINLFSYSYTSFVQDDVRHLKHKIRIVVEDKVLKLSLQLIDNNPQKIYELLIK